MTGIELDARAPSSTGLEPQFAGALAYLAGPFSGIIILLAEPTNRVVRFHAWQAIIGLGGFGLLTGGLVALAFAWAPRDGRRVLVQAGACAVLVVLLAVLAAVKVSDLTGGGIPQ